MDSPTASGQQAQSPPGPTIPTNPTPTTVPTTPQHPFYNLPSELILDIVDLLPPEAFINFAFANYPLLHAYGLGPALSRPRVVYITTQTRIPALFPLLRLPPEIMLHVMRNLKPIDIMRFAVANYQDLARQGIAPPLSAGTVGQLRHAVGMSRSDDPGHYFQTSDSLATSERKAAKAKNEHGQPITLPSKLLAVLAPPGGRSEVYVAEAAGNVKVVDLHVYRLALSQGGGPAIYAGCWDKNIYGAVLTGRLQATPWRPLLTGGHTDFVKRLLAAELGGYPVLISGGADATIIVWDVWTGVRIMHKLKGPAKAIQDLVVDPLGVPEELDESGGGLVLFSASSDREIRRWYIGRDRAYELPESIENPILAHETSVYKLCFDSVGDLWTASADKTAKHLVRSRDWECDTVLQHPDFVRDVVVDEETGLVVTACRDEEVRVWDASSGELVCVYSGHYEEVTGLALVRGWGVVSVSIDGTVRRWSLETGEMRKYLEEIEREKAGGEAKEGKREEKEGMLTAEEEAELAELMDDDD
ncbi:hypothetical protein B0A55_05041 [Friedmanniomyces simplex]|uniref:F-box domain-containing protein n=1 Tax=Friedmanniomyces simplex TaxID=329884 RepID=A0A4U0XHL1_9PEZI|nr:hypothetical protein B0A55_05041 [Friedmanniomyces simplex]